VPFNDPTLTDRIRDTMERHRRTLNSLEPERGCVVCNRPLDANCLCPRCDARPE
jgi:hypothetical protein